MTILSRIQKNENSCLDNPGLLSEYLVILSSHILNAERDKTLAEVKFAQKWSELRPTVESDKACDMKMKLTDEFVEMKSKEAMGKTILETIRSIKKRLAFLTIEFSELTR